MPGFLTSTAQHKIAGLALTRILCQTCPEPAMSDVNLWRHCHTPAHGKQLHEASRCLLSSKLIEAALPDMPDKGYLAPSSRPFNWLLDLAAKPIAPCANTSPGICCRPTPPNKYFYYGVLLDGMLGFLRARYNLQGSRIPISSLQRLLRGLCQNHGCI